MIESLSSERLRPTDSEREGALSAYVMTKGILDYNDLLMQGIKPTGSDGGPLYVTYRSEKQILEEITDCFGNGPRIKAAMNAAYNNYYEELLNRRK